MAVRAAGSKAGDSARGWTGPSSYADPTHGENIRKAEFNGVLGDMEGSNAYWDATQNDNPGRVRSDSLEPHLFHRWRWHSASAR